MFYQGEDDRSSLEKMRRTPLAKHAEANGVKFDPAATKGEIIRLMEGQGIRPPVATIGAKFSRKEDVEAAKGELADMIETMRPSELRALGKRYDVEIDVRMTEEQVAQAKRALIAKM